MIVVKSSDVVGTCVTEEEGVVNVYLPSIPMFQLTLAAAQTLAENLNTAVWNGKQAKEC